MGVICKEAASQGEMLRPSGKKEPPADADGSIFFRYVQALEMLLPLPFVNLTGGFFFGDAVAFLNLADELITLTAHLLQIVVGQLAPLLADTALELLPVPGDLIP